MCWNLDKANFVWEEMFARNECSGEFGVFCDKMIDNDLWWRLMWIKCEMPTIMSNMLSNEKIKSVFHLWSVFNHMAKDVPDDWTQTT